MILTIVANFILPLFVSTDPVDFSLFANEIRTFEKQMIFLDSVEKSEGKNRYKQNNSLFPVRWNDSAYRSRPAEKPLVIIELNAADTFDLQRLKGIGPGFAKRIVNYRERLGGYIEPQQILEVFGMDSSRYSGIRKYLTVNKDSVRKIDLNRITFKELMRHPYFPFELTKAIILYRKEHKKFGALEDLRELRMVNDSIFRKIEPYLKVMD
jgi:DNA uptake protein ComE-like DNA-binding protein